MFIKTPRTSSPQPLGLVGTLRTPGEGRLQLGPPCGLCMQRQHCRPAHVGKGRARAGRPHMGDRPLWRTLGVRVSGWRTVTLWVWPTPGPSPGSQSWYRKVTIQAESPGPTTAGGAASQGAAGAKGKMSFKTESAGEAGSAFKGSGRLQSARKHDDAVPWGCMEGHGEDGAGRVAAGKGGRSRLRGTQEGGSPPPAPVETYFLN